MCISAETSITTFVVSLIGSTSLIYYGNPKYKKENLIVGIFFMYVVFMQLLEYMMWIDLDNKRGWNQIASIVSPIFIILQPLFLLILKIIIHGFENLWVIGLNIGYFAYELYSMIPYYYKEKMITEEDNGHLNWKWNKYFSQFFGVIMTINIFASSPFFYALLFFISGFSMFLFSYKLDVIRYNSLWCWIVGFIPFIMLGGSYFV